MQYLVIIRKSEEACYLRQIDDVGVLVLVRDVGAAASRGFLTPRGADGFFLGKLFGG